MLLLIVLVRLSSLHPLPTSLKVSCWRFLNMNMLIKREMMISSGNPVIVLSHTPHHHASRTRQGVRRLRAVLRLGFNQTESADLGPEYLDPRYVVVDGRCCWRVFEMARFRGRCDTLTI